MIAWVVCLLVAFADEPRAHVFPVDGAPGSVEAAYAGDFASAPALEWRAELPGTPLASATHTERTRPIVVGDDLYIGSARGNAVYRLSRRNGTLIATYPGKDTVESEPLVVGDRLYFGDTGGNTWCYDVNGALVWSHRGTAPILARPTLSAGKLYIADVDDMVVALDATSGELAWRYQNVRDLTRVTELALYAAPAVVLVNGTAVLGFSDGTVAGVDALTGEMQWTKRVGEGRYPDIVADPVVDGNDVYVSGFYQPLLAIDAPTQNLRWRVDAGAAAAVTLGTVGDAKVVFHPGSDGKLRALSALTGAERWTWDSGSQGALTQPLLTPAGLLVAVSDGGIALVDPDTGTTAWRWFQPELLLGVSSTPVIAGRQLLVVTNAGNLYSFVAPVQKPAARTLAPFVQ